MPLRKLEIICFEHKEALSVNIIRILMYAVLTICGSSWSAVQLTHNKTLSYMFVVLRILRKL